MSQIPHCVAKAFDDVTTPASLEEANDTLQRLATVTRRSFFGGALAVGVPAAIMASTSEAKAATDAQITAVLRTGTSKRYIQEIQGNEYSHLQIILGAIRSLGGTPRPYPTFQGVITNDPLVLTRLGAAFCNTGASAYFGGYAYIQNPNVKAVAASLALVEAYQSGFLNSVLAQPLIPGAQTYVNAATIPQVVQAASPYIVSLNDNGMFPATFSTTPSPQNDIAILNFALLLEYLESTLYGNSVPMAYGS